MVSTTHGPQEYKSAAWRHYESMKQLEALALAPDTAPDQSMQLLQDAAYLAGYVLECSLKATVGAPPAEIEGKPWSHNLGALETDALKMAVLLSPALRRYPIASVRLSSGVWSETWRYDATDLGRGGDFRNVIALADKIVKDVLVGLTLDGTFKDMQ
jgi:hypothetical protein